MSAYTRIDAARKITFRISRRQCPVCDPCDRSSIRTISPRGSGSLTEPVSARSAGRHVRITTLPDAVVHPTNPIVYFTCPRYAGRLSSDAHGVFGPGREMCHGELCPAQLGPSSLQRRGSARKMKSSDCKVEHLDGWAGFPSEVLRLLYGTPCWGIHAMGMGSYQAG